jgi:hypothetical protein
VNTFDSMLGMEVYEAEYTQINKPFDKMKNKLHSLIEKVYVENIVVYEMF